MESSAVQATPAGAPLVPASISSAELWTCPICCDLLFKPTVNACGHIFCHWCLHKAMSPYSESRCPICRSPFGHFPAVCTKLDRLLLCHFPEAYAQRQQETEAEERELGLTPSTLETPPPAAPPSGYSREELLCDNPTCQRLLHDPLVLNCGHAVCASCVPGRAPSSSGGSSGSDAGACPACGHPVPAIPATCKTLDELLLGLFPAEQAQRAGEAAAVAAVSPPPASAAAEAEVGAAVEHAVAAPLQAPCQQQGEVAAGGSAAVAGSSPAEGMSSDDEPTTPRAAQQEGSGGAAADAAVSPSLLSAIHRRREEGEHARRVAERIENNLRSFSGENYVHHGVGCDVCGVYPIKGRRYQCKDCPDAVGFDLCGPCWERGVTSGIGRFNQRHTAEHRVELVRPRLTAMHLLQAANPELPMEQLMFLLELAMGGGGEEEGQGQQQAEGNQPPGQQGMQVGGGGQAAPEDEGGEGEGDGPIPMPRWRGPRPAPDPTAEEPSPSAIPQERGRAGERAQGGADGDMELVFVPLEVLLGGDEEENGNQMEEEGHGQQAQQGPGE